MKKSIAILIIANLVVNLSFGQSNVIDSIVHQSFQRKFTIHKPTGFTNSVPVPLVIFLHGGTGNMASAQGFTNLNAVSNANGFLAVYPQGYGVVPTGGYVWADGRGSFADIAGIDDIGFIDKLLDTIIANYNININKIYISGFSNGGFMTQRLACQLNQRFAAMSSLGCTMDTILFEGCNPTRPIPMLFMLGTADPRVPYNGGQLRGTISNVPVVGINTLVDFWKNNNQCITTNLPLNVPDSVLPDSSTVTLYKFTNCSCNSNISFYKIDGGGHTWPGVSIPSYEITAGPTNLDIQASIELWNFFNLQTLCNEPLSTNEPMLQTSINVFPNPVKTKLNLSIPLNERTEVSISNLLGQVLIKTKNQNAIDTSYLINGVYIITITNGQNKHTQKFIKE